MNAQPRKKKKCTKESRYKKESGATPKKRQRYSKTTVMTIQTTFYHLTKSLITKKHRGHQKQNARKAILKFTKMKLVMTIATVVTIATVMTVMMIRMILRIVRLRHPMRNQRQKNVVKRKKKVEMERVKPESRKKKHEPKSGQSKPNQFQKYKCVLKV